MRRIVFGLVAVGVGVTAPLLAPGSALAAEAPVKPFYCTSNKDNPNTPKDDDTFVVRCNTKAKYQAVITCRSRKDNRFLYERKGAVVTNNRDSSATCTNKKTDYIWTQRVWVDPAVPAPAPAPAPLFPFGS